MKQKLIDAFIFAIENNHVCWRNNKIIRAIAKSGTVIKIDTQYPTLFYNKELGYSTYETYIYDEVQNLKYEITYDEYESLVDMYEKRDEL